MTNVKKKKIIIIIIKSPKYIKIFIFKYEWKQHIRNTIG